MAAHDSMNKAQWDRSKLASWLARSGRTLERLQPLAGDVSPRRYARVEFADGDRAIVAIYPAELGESCRRFERTTGLLEGVAVRVPRILEADCTSGLMLLEDLGEQTLFDVGSLSLADRLPSFVRAIEIAARIAAVPPAEVADLNPPLDSAALWRELEQTIELFLEPRGLLGEGLADLLEQLCQALGRDQPVPCHRDFMARNLIALPGAELAVLDHQDLRLGPPAYDLASLLNDSFFPPAAVEASLLEGVLTSSAAWERYHRAAVQRTLKAIGTFTVFAKRGFDRHLRLIPPTLSRSLLHLGYLPEAASVLSELKPLWTPVLSSARS